VLERRTARGARSGLYLSACAQVDARRSAPGTGVAVCAQPRRLTPPRMGRITPKN